MSTLNVGNAMGSLSLRCGKGVTGCHKAWGSRRQDPTSVVDAVPEFDILRLDMVQTGASWTSAGLKQAHRCALVLVSALLLLAAATATQLHTVAGRPWTLPWLALHMPWPWLMWGGPATLLLAAPAIRFRARRTSIAALDRSLLILAVVAVLGMWLVCLVRHDRPLTAWHVLVVLALLALALGGRPGRVAGLLMAAPALGLVSYGAIWGETRCNESAGLRCLVSDGPRVWVPRALERVGVDVFVDLRGADLRGVDFSGRDLRVADMRGANLAGANLMGSNLRRARLDGVDAPGSNWQQAYLNGATMAGAQLAGADCKGVQAYLVDLRGTDLSGADLRGASLSHALLSNAILAGARLEGAYLGFTAGWATVNLRGVIADERTRWPTE